MQDVACHGSCSMHRAARTLMRLVSCPAASPAGGFRAAVDASRGSWRSGSASCSKLRLSAIAPLRAHAEAAEHVAEASVGAAPDHLQTLQGILPTHCCGCGVRLQDQNPNKQGCAVLWLGKSPACESSMARLQHNLPRGVCMRAAHTGDISLTAIMRLAAKRILRRQSHRWRSCHR